MSHVNLASSGEPLRGSGAPFGVVPAMRSHPRAPPICAEAARIPFDDPRVIGLQGYPKGDAQRRGLRYERQVMAALVARLPSIDHGPWLIYRMLGEPAHSVCQPDGLWYSEGDDRALVVEIKLVHTSEAWTQLRRYRSIARALFKDCEVQTLNIVRSFDPGVPFPEAQELFDDMDSVLADRSAGYRVLIWKR